MCGPCKAGLFAGTITTAKLKDSEAISGRQLSNEKNLGWLGYIGDYTTQLYRDPY